MRQLVKLEKRAEADPLLVAGQHVFLGDAELIRDCLSDLVGTLPIPGLVAGLLSLSGQRVAVVVRLPDTGL